MFKNLHFRSIVTSTHDLVLIETSPAGRYAYWFEKGTYDQELDELESLSMFADVLPLGSHTFKNPILVLQVMKEQDVKFAKEEIDPIQQQPSVITSIFTHPKKSENDCDLDTGEWDTLSSIETYLLPALDLVFWMTCKKLDDPSSKDASATAKRFSKTILPHLQNEPSRELVYKMTRFSAYSMLILTDIRQ